MSGTVTHEYSPFISTKQQKKVSFWEITQRGQMPYTFAGRITGPLLSLWIPTSVLLQSVSGSIREIESARE